MKSEEVRRIEVADEYLNYTLARLKTGQGNDLNRWDNLPTKALIQNRLQKFLSETEAPVFEMPAHMQQEMYSIIDDWYDGNSNPDINAGLNEGVLVADGARPVGLIQNDELGLIVGNGPFVNLLESNHARISQASLSVGRLERDLAPEVKWADTWYAGTGFYIGQNLLVTNRHVLQALSQKNRFKSEASKKLPSGCYINFDGQLIKVENGKSVVGQRRFLVTEVVWTSDTIIPRDRDRLAEIDLAILRIENDSGQVLPDPLKISKDSLEKDQPIAVIGFPGKPPFFKNTYNRDDVLETGNAEQIITHFVNRGFGFKRTSAGLFGDVSNGGAWNPNGLNIRHDCSTLTGNSGSPIFHINPDSPHGSLEVAACHFFGWGRDFNVAHRSSLIRESIIKALKQHGAIVS